MKRSLPLAMISIMQLGTTRPIRSIQIDLHERRPPTSTQRAGRGGRSAIICPTSFHVTAWVRKAQRTQGPKNCASSSSNHRGHKYFFALFTSASTSYLRLSNGIVLLFCWIPHPPNSRDTPEHHGSPFLLHLFLDLLLYLDS